MPFLVDSVTMALAEQGIGVHVLGHPVVTFRRDKAGKLVGVGEGVPESLMHLEIDRQPAEAMPQIQAGDRRPRWPTCARSVRDWAPMRDKMRRDRRRAGRAQAAGQRRGPRARRRNSCAGRPTTTSPSSATASTRSSSKGGEEVLRAVDGQRPGPAARRGRRQAAPADVAGRALHAAVGFGRCADPDQDQRALHRASPGLHGLHRRAELRRQGQAGARAALPRPVHLQRLQPPPVGHPAGAPAPRTT